MSNSKTILFLILLFCTLNAAANADSSAVRKKSKGDHFIIGVQLSPMIGRHFTTAEAVKNPNDYFKAVKLSTDRAFCYMAKVDLFINFNQRWGIRSGYYYSNFAQRTKFDDPFMQTTNLFYGHTYFYELPLMLQYYVSDDKFRFFPSLGLSWARLQKSEFVQVIKMKQGEQNSTTFDVTSSRIKENLIANLGIGARYVLNPNFSLYLDAQYRYTFNTVSIGGFEYFNAYALGFGCSVGVF